MEVAALAEHPEEVGGVKVVEGGGDQPAPDLQKQRGIRERLTLTLTLAQAAIQAPEPARRLTTLLSCTSGFMVSCTMNQVAFLRMKAVMRFQWMMFLRQRMLLSDQRQTGYTGPEWTDKLVKLWLSVNILDFKTALMNK